MIYLDNAATSFPKPPCIKESIIDFIDNIGSNTARAAYKSALQSSRILYDTRLLLAKLINLPNASRIFFTYNATYALNFALNGILKANDKVLITQIEHNAIMRPLKWLQSTRNIEIREIPTNRYCGIDLQEANRMAKGVKLIACVGGNNVTGAILPIDSLKQIAKDNNALFLLDATQILGLYPLDSTGIDVICGSAHKGLLAPMGVGICAMSENIEPFESLVFGGTGSQSDELLQPQFLPDKYESGTPNMHGIVALRSSLQWIDDFGINKIWDKENAIREKFVDSLRKIDGITLCEVEKGYDTTGVLSFHCKDLSMMAYLLDERFGICVRAGLHCSVCTHKTIGTFIEGNAGTIRISPSIWTSESEIETTIYAIQSILKEL